MVVLAPVCSGFSYMCSSQAMRFHYCPEGNEDIWWVKAGNVKANRVTLLCWLAAALGHTFIVEQPGSAKFGDMPRWQHFCQTVCFAPFLHSSLGLRLLLFWGCPGAEVFRQKIWMRHYGVKSWKNTCLWSNSCRVQELDLGPLSKESKAASEPLAHGYIDSRGKKRCYGKRELKESQSLGNLNSFGGGLRFK